MPSANVILNTRHRRKLTTDFLLLLSAFSRNILTNANRLHDSYGLLDMFIRKTRVTDILMIFEMWYFYNPRDKHVYGYYLKQF